MSTPYRYRIKAYLRHFFTAWNTHGENIHSPYLFYLVDKLFYDKNSYYCFRDIEQQRDQLLHNNSQVHTCDYGTGTTGTKTIRYIAKNEVEKPRVAQLLFRLIAYMTRHSDRPLQIVELGTSLGITTAYLSAPASQNEVVTMEGSPEILKIAQQNWQKLGLKNIRAIEGNIDDTLYIYARAIKSPIDFVYMDANHTYEATIRYFNILLDHAHDKTIFAIDDIHHSPEMEQAWNDIKQHERVTTSMDFFHFGLIMIDPHYIKRHYKLRL